MWAFAKYVTEYLTPPFVSPPATVRMQLQEHAARTLCTLLGVNKELRQKALQDGFLDRLQAKGRE